MTQTPLVSICIPVYNSGAFIKETLESVLAQSYPSIEVVVVDDGSKDDTVKIIESMKDPRLKFHKNAVNLGVSGNWNRSIELATGEFIKIMGGDDLLDKDCVKHQVEVIQSHHVSLVTSHKYVINSKGKQIVLKRTFSEGLIKGKEAFRLSMIDGSNLLGEPVAGLFRRSDFYKAGEYTSEFMYLIDLDLWYRLLGEGSVYVIAKPLYSFRISRTSLSSVLKGSQIDEFERFKSKLIQTGYISLSGAEKLRAKFNSFVKGIARKIIFMLMA